MEAFRHFLFVLLGPDGKATELTLLQIALRGFVIFVAALAMIRIGDRRSLSEKTAFDAIFIVLLGSMLSRAINGTAPFLTTIGAGIALMIIHRLCAYGSFYSHTFGKLVKGNPVEIVRDGIVQRKQLARCLVTEHDLEEDMRLDAQIGDVKKIKVARIERSGDISFIKNDE